MDSKKVLKLISNLKKDIASLESELNGILETENKATIRDTFNIEYANTTYGGKNGFSQRAVFAFIIKNEAESKSLTQLNKLFDKSQFPKKGGFAAYDYIIDRSVEKSLSKDLKKRYSPVDVLTNDGKSIMIFNQWGQHENKENQSPGNFPVLIKIAKKLGYRIKKVQK